MEKHILSKSTFIRGMQCEKSLYLNKYHRELKDELSASQEAIFAQGTSVGELAQSLFPGGIDCSPENYYEFQESVLKTASKIHEGHKVIYEAAFQYNGILAALDILVLKEDGWHAFEVKSSTKVSQTYLMDAAIQYYVITNSGIELQDISIVHINNQYIKNGEIDCEALFTIVSVKEDVLKQLDSLPIQIDKLKQTLFASDVPKIDIGPHCDSPYACDFKGHCWQHVPKYSVFNISRLHLNKKFELYNKGILLLKDVPDDFPLNYRQWFQVYSDYFEENIINRKAIREYNSSLNYPIHHLDFETFGTAVPIFDQSRPYQQLVFQYSMHIEYENGVIAHKEYLAEINGDDPREKFIDCLLNDCEKEGDILVYNISFERTKLKELQQFAPDHADEIQKLIDRLKDLMLPFQKGWYYTPAMKGSYSIKKVLPALVPEMSYNELTINDGGTASNTFAQLIMGHNEDQIVEKRRALLEYCKMDTLAMVKILEVLKKV